MTKNLLKRILISIILLLLLLVINFSNKYIFALSIILVGTLIYVEANSIFIKIRRNNFLKKIYEEKFNIKFFFLNISTFLYIFFIFCYFSYEIHRTQSPIFFLYIISICFFTDIGGYFFGKIIGGKKLTKISPNKTISGSVGSFIFSLIPYFIFKLIFLNSNIYSLSFTENLLFNILISLFLSMFCQIGDLFISYFKRLSNLKDTRKILPGHGGLLDRIDGIIFAIPSFALLAYLLNY